MRPIDELLKVLTKHQLAEAAGVDVTTIYYWIGGMDRGENGGFLPSRYIPKVFSYLQEKRLAFSLERLCGIPPRKRSGKRKN